SRCMAQLIILNIWTIVCDIASVNSRNSVGTEDKQTVVIEGVTIIGSSALPATMPEDATKMYSKNLHTFLKLLLNNDQLNLNFEDEIIKGTCITHEGAIVFQPLLTN